MAARSAISSVFRPGLFAGKSALVTGGGTGIGQAITLELLYLGCNVMIASRNADRLLEAADSMRSTTEQYKNVGRLEAMQCNIRHEEQISDTVATTLKKFGCLDFLVNNSGGQFFSPAKEYTLKGWNAVVETNLTGTFLCCREAFNQGMKDRGGAIINIVANMFNGWPGMSHSGAARAGIDNITKSLAVEWAPNGVRVNAVAPGSSIFSPSAVSHYKDQEVAGENIFTRNRPRIPAKRLGKTEEVSGAVCFLLSPAASFISGATVRVDGAQSLYSTSVPWVVPDHDKLPAFTWEKDNPPDSDSDGEKS